MVRTLLRRCAGGVLLPVAVVCAVAAGAAGFFATAAATAWIPLLCAAGLVALSAVAYLLAWPAFALLAVRRRRRAATTFAAGVAVVVGGLAAVTVFRPGPHPAAPAPPAGVRFWDLPTGSRIAYAHAAATGTPRPAPVIFLHGGPGTPGDGMPRAGTTLAADGFEVYAYDQLGAGRSTRLGDVTGYTVARQVADLEAIRVTIGADKIILIGQSWGGSLAAQYLAAHPQHVARAVFTSPGPIWPGAYPDDGGGGDPWARLSADQRERRDDLLSSPRVAVQSILQAINPNAAHALVGDDEADALLHTIAVLGKDTTGCPGASAAKVHDNHQGFYVNQLTVEDFAHVPDPRPALRQLRVPALIMRGECDFVPWVETYEYRRTLQQATLVYLPHTGHSLESGQPDAYVALLRAYLRDEPLPLPAYTSADPPS
ncbi:alpha/beta fold hydrolase [Dactylosporangium sp. NPDC051485]|uniref:alpha/beta fold hydrolase n=1 Tax=Dactylosporangium sp. NPDC051485 TaxID=3154846 RepID=UPI003420E3D0